MSLKDLSQGDFEFYRRKAQAMRKLHEDEFMRVIDPELMKAMYRGRTKKKSNTGDYVETENEAAETLAFSRLFQATNTLLPNLMYQMPSPLVIPKRVNDRDGAALMSALLKHYAKLNNSKQQNQNAVMSAWFFGIGWKKLGYRTVFLPKVDEPETTIDQSILGKIGSAASSIFGKPDNTESRERPDLVDYETLYNDVENPCNIMLDDKADLLNRKAILHRLPRTVHDLEVFGDYDEELLQELYSKMKTKYGSRFDSRESDIWLNELHVQQRNGVWILTWCDEFEKPIRYEKSTYQGKGFLYEPLVFTNEPGVRYPISHMKVASQVQDKLDKLATMYVTLVARSMNVICVNERALGHGQDKQLEKNLMRGILRFKDKVSDSDIRSFTSSQVPADLQNLMSVLQQNITEIMGADEQMVGGRSKNDTLGQDELARVGTKVRESGMQDKVRDFLIEQLRKEGTLLKQFSGGELSLAVTGKDYFDVQTGQSAQDRWLEFGTINQPLGAKHFLQGEFDYDINIEEAIKPSRVQQQQAYEKMFSTLSSPVVQQALLSAGVKVRLDLVAKGYIETFQNVGNPDQYVEQLDPTQQAAAQTAQLMMQNGGNMPTSRPTNEEVSPETEVTQRSSVQANQ